MKRKRLLILTLFFALVFIQATPVNAHNPSSINLNYDFASQELSVVVTHSVTDPVTHRIQSVVVERNSLQVIGRAYAQQNTTAEMEAVYSISAVHGDVFHVIATCSISGQIDGLETVIDPAMTDTTTPTPPAQMDMTLIIAVAIVAIGVIAVVFGLMRRR
ncbi:MAG: hypothetical protein ACW98U_01960 [Candidatus Thorarchaeota archaeon]